MSHPDFSPYSSTLPIPQSQPTLSYPFYPALSPSTSHRCFLPQLLFHYTPLSLLTFSHATFSLPSQLTPISHSHASISRTSHSRPSLTPTLAPHFQPSFTSHSRSHSLPSHIPLSLLFSRPTLTLRSRPFSRPTLTPFTLAPLSHPLPCLTLAPL